MNKSWGAFLLVGALLSGLEVNAQSAYPPSGFMKVGSQVSLELRQNWTTTVAGKDSDGDWTGDAKSATGTNGKFYALALNGAAFRFQVAYTGASEFCDLAGANSVGNASSNSVTYTGTRFFKQGAASITSDNTPCRVTITNAAVPAVVQPVQPPSLPSSQAQNPALTFPPRLAVGQRWEIRLGNRAIVYRGALTGLDSARNVYTGTLATDGAGDPVAQRKLEVFFAQDTLAMYATDPQGGITVCSFAGAASLQNNVFTGSVFYRAPGASQFTTLTAVQDAPCKANLEPVAQVVQPISPVQPVQPVSPVQPVQTLTASLPIQVGDSWRVVAAGFEPWLLSFTKTEDGSPAGTATQGGAQGEALGLKQSNGGHAFLIGIGNRIFACVISPNAPVQGAVVVGSLFEIVTVNNQNQTKDLNASCAATLTARGGGGISGALINPPPVQSLTAVFPPKIGQTWTVTIDGLAPWVILFKELDKDNDPNGSGLQNGLARNAVAFLSDGLKVFLMAGDNNVRYYCVFTATIQPVGATFSGGQALQAAQGAQSPSSMNKACTATLTAQQLLKAASVSLETQVFNPLPSILKLSPLF